MPPQALLTLPNGSNVFLDANVLIYGLSGTSQECKDLLIRCVNEEVTGVTSYQVVSEITHRLMCMEALSKGLAAHKPRETLQKDPQLVKQLSEYWTDTERVLALNLLFLVLDEQTIRAAHPERLAHGLLNNDSIVVASMRLYGMNTLATRDEGFSGVDGITVYSPTDV